MHRAPSAFISHYFLRDSMCFTGGFASQSGICWKRCPLQLNIYCPEMLWYLQIGCSLEAKQEISRGFITIPFFHRFWVGNPGFGIVTVNQPVSSQWIKKGESLICDLKFLRLVSVSIFPSVFPNFLAVGVTNFPWSPSFPAVFTPLTSHL